MNLPHATIAAHMVCVTSVSFQRSLDKIDRLITQESVPVQVLTAVLANDPMLTAQILAEANATSSIELTQLSAAMLHVGLGSVLGVVRSTNAIPEAQRQDLASCWSHANACAALTRLLANYCVGRLQIRYDEETLQCAGLLHDFGSIIAVTQFPAEYARACDRLDQEEGSFSELLKEELGCNPAKLGELFAQTWRLPALYTACIRYHAEPTRTGNFNEIVCLVHVAHVLARACGFVGVRDRFVEPFDEEALRRLDLHLTDLERLIEQFFDEREDYELFEGALGTRSGLQINPRR
jgi:HD-like signal output (HDOD) protein